MARSYRDNKQRFHRGRQGGLLVPHGALSGLLFTINPRQDTRAVREAQMYLGGLIRDLEAAQERAALASAEGADDDDSHGQSGASSDDDTVAPVVQSTSSLLAAELAASVQSDREGRKRARDENTEESGENGEEGKDGGDRQRGPPRSQKWFTTLETHCKGYLFLNIPTVNPRITCQVCHGSSKVLDDATEPGKEGEQEGDVAVPPSSDRNGLPPHSIVINPLVSHVVERIFDDLTKNPRPVFKNCFRLMPVEVTCCPTLPEMQKAVTTLLSMYFGPPATALDTEVNNAESSPINFTEAIPIAAAHPPLRKRTMHVVSLQLTIKNNTNAEAKKTQWLSTLQSALPANRFIVPKTASALKSVEVDAVVSIFVLHSTCMMGVQRHYTNREGYNVHAISKRALELVDSVVCE